MLEELALMAGELLGALLDDGATDGGLGHFFVGTKKAFKKEKEILFLISPKQKFRKN